MAVMTWAVVGLLAETTGRLKSDKPEQERNISALPLSPAANPQAEPSTVPSADDLASISPEMVAFYADHPEILANLTAQVDAYKASHPAAAAAG